MPRITIKGATGGKPDKRMRGLGDVVAAVTHATGIDRVVKAVVGNCGCGERRAALNEMFPFTQSGDGPDPS